MTTHTTGSAPFTDCTTQNSRHSMYISALRDDQASVKAQLYGADLTLVDKLHPLAVQRQHIVQPFSGKGVQRRAGALAFLLQRHVGPTSGEGEVRRLFGKEASLSGHEMVLAGILLSCQRACARTSPSIQSCCVMPLSQSIHVFLT